MVGLGLGILRLIFGSFGPFKPANPSLALRGVSVRLHKGWETPTGFAIE